MHRTIFDTPVVNTVLRALSVSFLKHTGWTVQGALPPECAKSVFIAAPHTSNWDLPYTLMVAFALRLNIYWMGKASIFRFPFGGVMRWLGGIEVNRAQSNNLWKPLPTRYARPTARCNWWCRPKAPAARRVTGRRGFITSPYPRKCPS